MDPVTATGLVASIIQLIGVIAKAEECLNDRKDAIKERQTPVQGVAGLLTYLKSLKYQVDEAKGTDAWFTCLRLLPVGSGLLDRFGGAMEALVKTLKSVGGMQIFGRALIWTLDTKKITDILIKAERLKRMIIFFLGKFNCELPKYFQV